MSFEDNYSLPVPDSKKIKKAIFYTGDKSITVTTIAGQNHLFKGKGNFENLWDAFECRKRFWGIIVALDKGPGIDQDHLLVMNGSDLIELSGNGPQI
jgi:hypothetical protein